MMKMRYINVATIGHVDHGKTTLTAAITKVCAKFNPEANEKAAKEYNEIDKTKEEKERGITINSTTVHYSWGNSYFAHTDCPGHRSFVKNMIVGASQADCALLVISTDGIQPQTVEHVLLAQQTGIKQIIVVINKIDVVPEGERETFVEFLKGDIFDLLEKYGFDVKDIPVISLSAFKAYKGDPKEEENVKKLLDTMVSYIKDPVRDEEKPFLLPIEDVFTISGRGTVVTGKVERGKCTIDDRLELIGIKNEQKEVVVTGLETFKTKLNEAKAGENVGVLLRGLQRSEVERGQVLVAPGSIKAHSKFTAQLYVLKTEEGGRKTPFSKRFSPQVFIRTANQTCTFEFPDGVEVVMPGDNVLLTVQLLKPLAVEKGTKMAFREGNNTIAAGKVIDILD